MKKALIIGIIFITTSVMAQSYQLASFPQYELNYYQGVQPIAESWDTRDTLFELGFLAISGIDLWQTYTFLYKDNNGKESNSFLSDKPSKQKLFIVSGVWALMHFGISYILPTHYLRNIWQVMTIYGHFYCVIRNYSMGAKISF